MGACPILHNIHNMLCEYVHYSVYINCRSSDAFRSNTHPDRPFPCMNGTTVRPVSARVFSVGAQSRSMRASIGRGLRARCVQWPESSSTSTSSSEDSSTGGPIVKRSSISASTVEKWKFENDRAATWLMYDKADRDP